MSDHAEIKISDCLMFTEFIEYFISIFQKLLHYQIDEKSFLYIANF